MGQGQSREEAVFIAAKKNDVATIRGLRQQGAGLEWRDAEGRTPLIQACLHPENYDAARALLELGADVKAYRRGPAGGQAIHHAAKKGLDRHIILLLQYRADILVPNDAGDTPISMARNRGLVSTVRLLEDKVCLFCGPMRQQTMPSLGGFLDALSSLGMKQVWVVILPAQTSGVTRFELVLYPSAVVAQPTAIIPLEHAEITIAKPESAEPILIINDTQGSPHCRRGRLRAEFQKVANDFTEGNKYKLVGDRETVTRAFNAARGVPQRGTPQYGVPNWQAPAPAALPPASQTPSQTPSVVQSVGYGNQRADRDKFTEEEDMALKLAIEESLVTARQGAPPPQEGGTSDNYGGWADAPTSSYNEWGPVDSQSQASSSSSTAKAAPAPAKGLSVPPAPPAKTSSPAPYRPGMATTSVFSAGGAAQPPPPNRTVYSAGGPTRPPRTTPAPMPVAPTPVRQEAPTAPPLTEGVSYPTIDSTPVQIPAFNVRSEAQVAGTAEAAAPPGKEDKCVICWDNPREGACVPCGHVVGCMDCLSMIKGKKMGCPVCRAPIQQVVRIYQV